METEETTIPTAAEPISDPAMEEHRAALCKMRTAYALEQLYAASGARDPAVLSRLIDVEQTDIVIGEDGVPDVTAVKDKIDTLRREKSYLFADAPAVSAAGHPVSPSAPSCGAMAARLGVMTQSDFSQMDDASYYRAVMGKKSRSRR